MGSQCNPFVFAKLVFRLLDTLAGRGSFPWRLKICKMFIVCIYYIIPIRSSSHHFVEHRRCRT